MPIDSKPQIIKRVEALENRYTDTGLNTQTFPISDSVDSDRSDVAASSKAVKTAYDAGTRYATTTQQGQVILTHDVENGAQDRALTPFGANTAMDELEKNITGRLNELDSRLDLLEKEINEKIDQIRTDLESKFNELNNKIEGKLPLFDSHQVLDNKWKDLYLPNTGSLWFYTMSTTFSSGGGTQDPSDDSNFSTYSCSIAEGGTLLTRGDATGTRTCTVHCWRIFP